jgi:hypothetical protein
LKTPISVLRAGIEEILTDPDTPAKQQTRATPCFIRFTNHLDR